MLRDEWKFDYKSGDVGEAAVKKIENHERRIEFWKTKQAEVMEAIKASGIEITESLASAYTSNAGHGARVAIKPEFQEKLDECFIKIREHTSKRDGFIAFAEALRLNPNQTVQLDVSDIQFFYGK